MIALGAYAHTCDNPADCPVFLCKHYYDNSTIIPGGQYHLFELFISQESDQSSVKNSGLSSEISQAEQWTSKLKVVGSIPSAVEQSVTY